MTVLGPKFGEDSDMKAILVRSFYYLKSVGYAFWNHSSEFMYHLGFLPCTADLDLWMKPMLRPGDGFYHSSYVLIYRDDVMVINYDAESVFRRIDNYFQLNPSSMDVPDIYLEAKLKKTRLDNRLWT